MFREVFTVALFLAVTGPAVADTAELYGRADGVNWPTLSPSGDLLAVQCAPQGEPSVCIFDIATGGESKFIPVDNGFRLEGIHWASDDYLLIDVSVYESVQTVDGQKEYDFKRAISYSVKSGEATTLMRDRYGVLDTQNVVSVLPSNKNNVLVYTISPNTARSSSSLGSINPERGGTAWTLSTFKANLKTGKSRQVDSFGKATIAAWFDRAGETVLEKVKPDRSDGVKLRHNGKTILDYDSAGADEFFIYGFDQASGQMIVFNDVGDQDGLNYMSLEDGSMEPIRLGDVDVGRATAVIDPYTRDMVGFTYFDGLDVQVFTDPELRATHEKLSTALPGQRVNLVSWASDRSKIAISARKPGRPTDFYVFDAATGQLAPVGSQASHLVSQPTGTVVTRKFLARDGIEVEAILTLPPGKSVEDGPFPTVLMPHGGPEARDGTGFDWWTQAYAAAGYMVIQPNFRGSSGYGQAFRNAGFGEFGGKMIDDISDAGAWAVEQGLVAGDSYCAVGASYGGYAALMLGLKDAGQTACIISVNGVSAPFALVGQYASGSEAADYWERYLGSDRFDSDEVRGRISPAARSVEITQPVMLMYGEEDLTVPTDQTLRLARTFDGRAGFELVNLGKEDHYLRSTFARSKLLKRSIAFLNENHPAR